MQTETGAAERRSFPAIGALAGSAAVLVIVVLIGVWALEEQDPLGDPDLELNHARPHAQGDYYVLAVREGPSNLNPFTVTGAVARRLVLSYTHDELLKIDPGTGREIPSLAERIDAEADGKTYTVHLRRDVSFSDGEPLRLDDVLFTWELAGAGLPGSMWTNLQLIESLEPVGEWSFRMVLGEAHFAALGTVATSFTVGQRRWFEAEVARRAEAAGKPVPAGPRDEDFARLLLEITESGPGTGPYRIAHDVESGAPMWRPDEHLMLVQNSHSWRIPAFPGFFNLAGLKLVVAESVLEKRALLRTQGIDWFEDPDPEGLLEQRPSLTNAYRPMSYRYLNQGPVFVVWNHKHPALADRRVREALSLLFDRDQLLTLRGEMAEPVASWFLPETPRAGDDPPLPFDVERARNLLAEAGVEGLELSVLVIAHPEYEEIVDLAIPAFARAGITLRKEVVEYSVLIDRRDSRDFDGFVYAWNPDVYNDPTEIFHSSLSQHNWMGYASAEMDRVLESARAELDPEARVAAYREFNRVMREDHPITLLYHRRVAGLLHKRFQNVEVGVRGLSPRAWWVEPRDQLHQWGMR